MNLDLPFINHMTNNDINCNNINSITYDSYITEMYNSGNNIINNNEFGSICCRSVSSCFDANSIIINNNDNNITSSIVCGGKSSCRSVPYIHSTHGVYCTGQYGMYI